VVERIKLKNIHITLEESAKDFLIEKGYDPSYGARPMRRAVEKYLEDPMAEDLLRGTIKAGETVLVKRDGEKLVFSAATEKPTPSEAAAG
jgi:ATP-dependent Clp protease ATP-binding subunit ClpC